MISKTKPIVYNNKNYCCRLLFVKKIHNKIRVYKECGKMAIDYRALGAKIKEYRKKENITQEQLAEMADISLSHMSNVETASASVSLPALKLIADALDVTLDDLLVDSYSEKQKSYLYSRKMECILEQCETVEQEIIVNTASALADNLVKNRK